MLEFLYLPVEVRGHDKARDYYRKNIFMMRFGGLEKLINANRSVRKVNVQLFPVKLMVIPDWKSRFE